MIADTKSAVQTRASVRKRMENRLRFGKFMLGWDASTPRAAG